MGFNGATAFRRWKQVVGGENVTVMQTASMGPPPFGDGNPSLLRFGIPLVFRLQWGHRLSAMETRPCCASASLWSSGFNGATAFRRWKLGVFVAANATSRGFNGATAFRRWKHGRGCSPASSSAMLQWGHRLSAMETRLTGRGLAFLSGLQWGHRLSAMETHTGL